MKDLENSGASTDATEGGGDVGAGVVFDLTADIPQRDDWVQSSFGEQELAYQQEMYLEMQRQCGF